MYCNCIVGSWNLGWFFKFMFCALKVTVQVGYWSHPQAEFPKRVWFSTCYGLKSADMKNGDNPCWSLLQLSESLTFFLRGALWRRISKPTASMVHTIWDQKPSRLFRGWNPTQLYEDYFKSHWKDPGINQLDFIVSCQDGGLCFHYRFTDFWPAGQIATFSILIDTGQFACWQGFPEFQWSVAKLSTNRPVGSMYGIFAYMCHKNQPHVV